MNQSDSQSNKATTVFISKARAIHGDRYDYAKVSYTRNEDKVCIICSEHGDFLQTPHHHLKGEGCWECGVAKRGKAQREKAGRIFVEKAEKRHGRRYGYAGVRYEFAVSKISILCYDHGIFQQTARSHLAGYGCPRCGVIELGKKNNERAKKAFFKRAEAAHGRRYSYAGTEYVSSTAKVSILCRKHGPFLQTPHHHLRGTGCPACGIESANQGKTEAARRRRQKAMPRD